MGVSCSLACFLQIAEGGRTLIAPTWSTTRERCCPGSPRHVRLVVGILSRSWRICAVEAASSTMAEPFPICQKSQTMATTSGATTEKSSDALSRLRIQRTESRPQRSWFGTFLKWVLVIVLLAGLAGGGLVAASRFGLISGTDNMLQLPEAMQSRPEVRLASVTVETGRSADATVVATGYLESRYQARIGARAPGRMEVVNVEEGSRVEKGQVLAVLEHADLDASLAAVEATHARAKAALAEQEIAIQRAKRDFERAEKMLKSKGVTEAAYDEAKFGYDGAVARFTSMTAEVALAAARVSEAQQMKANMFIRAPFNGTVISKDAEVGESILPGGMGEASGRGSAVTVADLEHLEVDCDVKEDFISRVVPGQSAEVAVDAVPGTRYQGKVRKVIPMGNRARATIQVKVAIVNVDERLFPEMSATVYFLPNEAEAAAEKKPERRVFCDAEAIKSDAAGKSFVWALDDNGRVRRIDVETGLKRELRTEISKGLNGGERVIVAPPNIEPGQLVKIAS